jgi:hypothetical protein
VLPDTTHTQLLFACQTCTLSARFPPRFHRLERIHSPRLLLGVGAPACHTPTQQQQFSAREQSLSGQPLPAACCNTPPTQHPLQPPWQSSPEIVPALALLVQLLHLLQAGLCCDRARLGARERACSGRGGGGQDAACSKRTCFIQPAQGDTGQRGKSVSPLPPTTHTHLLLLQTRQPP